MQTTVTCFYCGQEVTRERCEHVLALRCHVDGKPKEWQMSDFEFDALGVYRNSIGTHASDEIRSQHVNPGEKVSGDWLFARNPTKALRILRRANEAAG